MNDRGERLIDVAVAGCGVFLAAFFVFSVGGWGSDALRQPATDGAYLPPALPAVVAGVHLVRRGGLDPHARRVWSFITMGRRYGQGYPFHRPQPPDQLAELLRGAEVTIGR